MYVTPEQYNAIVILISLLCGVNRALQCGTNISTSAICTEWSVFSGMVTKLCRVNVMSTFFCDIYKVCSHSYVICVGIRSP